MDVALKNLRPGLREGRGMISYRATPELVLLDQWPRQVACDPQRVRERPADLAHRQTGDRHEIDAFAVFAQ